MSDFLEHRKNLVTMTPFFISPDDENTLKEHRSTSGTKKIDISFLFFHFDMIYFAGFFQQWLSDKNKWSALPSGMTIFGMEFSEVRGCHCLFYGYQPLINQATSLSSTTTKANTHQKIQQTHGEVIHFSSEFFRVLAITESFFIVLFSDY